jgi:hypothetical protein
MTKNDGHVCAFAFEIAAGHGGKCHLSSKGSDHICLIYWFAVRPPAA